MFWKFIFVVKIKSKKLKLNKVESQVEILNEKCGISQQKINSQNVEIEHMKVAKKCMQDLMEVKEKELNEYKLRMKEMQEQIQEKNVSTPKKYDV